MRPCPTSHTPQKKEGKDGEEKREGGGRGEKEEGEDGEIGVGKEHLLNSECSVPRQQVQALLELTLVTNAPMVSFHPLGHYS